MKIVWNYLGILLIISAFFRIPPIIVGLVLKEPINGFIITFVLSLVFGLILYFVTMKDKGSMTLEYGLILTALSFLVIPLISSITFLPIFNYNPLNAFFETISGFTTTGLSVIDIPLNELPKSILLWRAETQWMGGIGIVMVFLFILSRLRGHTYNVEAISERGKETNSLYMSAGFPEKIEPSIKKATFDILFIYGIYTVIGILTLWYFSMPLIDAVGMAFTSISTGGFTMSDTVYTNNFQLIILSLLMIIGSISFIAHSKLMKFKLKEFLSNNELRIFLVLISIMFVVSFTLVKDFKTTIFHLISSFTTTGYSTTNISLLPSLFIFFIMISMIIGGTIGSTAGGLKLYRAFILLKCIPWLLKKLCNPTEAIILFKINKKVIEEKDLLITYIYIGCYLLLLVLGTVIFMIFGHPFLDSSFQIISALGTVGLSTMQISVLNPFLKIILIIAMILGRLEIFPLFVLIRRSFISIKSKL